MKTFTTFRSVKQLRAACRKRGWKLRTERFDSLAIASDYVSIDFSVGRVSGTALVSTFNGRFFGETKTGRRFTSNDARHETQPWFRSLLNTVYV